MHLMKGTFNNLSRHNGVIFFYDYNTAIMFVNSNQRIIYFASCKGGKSKIRGSTETLMTERTKHNLLLQSVLLFNSAISMFFGISKQIKESKCRNS